MYEEKKGDWNVKRTTKTKYSPSKWMNSFHFPSVCEAISKRRNRVEIPNTILRGIMKRIWNGTKDIIQECIILKLNIIIDEELEESWTGGVGNEEEKQ